MKEKKKSGISTDIKNKEDKDMFGDLKGESSSDEDGETGRDNG